MTDSRNDAQSVVMKDGRACWELNGATVAYPLMIQMNISGKNRYFDIFVHLKPYSSDRLISILNAVPGSYRRNTSDVETFSGDDSSFATLTSECFVKLEGTASDDPAVQRRWLDQNPRQKVRIARDLLGGLEIDTDMPSDVPSDEGAKLELLPLALECAESRVSVLQELWDPDFQMRRKVRMTHVLRAENEADWRKWGRTGNEKFNKATRNWSSNVNWWQRSEIYDGMVQSIDGMLVKGQPCTAANKADWISLVPAWHKLLVITTVFDETRVKNV